MRYLESLCFHDDANLEGQERRGSRKHVRKVSCSCDRQKRKRRRPGKTSRVCRSLGVSSPRQMRFTGMACIARRTPGQARGSFNRMKTNQQIVLTRDCEATTVPGGSPYFLRSGSTVRLTQALGGSYTVMNDTGYILLIDAKNADALGLTPGTAA